MEEKVELDWYGWSFVIMIAGVLGFGGWLFYKTFDDINKNTESKIEYNRQVNEFTRTFNTKVNEYGDVNNDGIIQDKERTDLGLRILREKGILIEENYNTFKGFPRPRDINGNYIPLKDLTQWIEDYKEK